MKLTFQYRLRILLLCLTALCSINACTNPPTKKITKPEIKHIQIINKIILDTILKLVNDPEQEKLNHPYTFDRSKIYSAADTNSSVITIIPAFTKLNIVERKEVQLRDTVPGQDGQPPIPNEWSMIFYKVNINGNSEGYIFTDNVAKYVYTDSVKKTQYFMGSYIDKKRDSYTFRIAKRDLVNHRLLIYKELRNYFLEAELEIFTMKNMPLKNVDRIIKIVGHRFYCGQGDNGVMIADVNNKFIELPSSYIGGDDEGGIDNTNMYMPEWDKTGKLVLKLNVLGGFSDNTNLTVPYPSELNIPINELLAETKEEGQYARDEKNDDIMLKNGKYKMDLPLTLTTRYYHWDGKSVTKLPGKKVERL